MDTPVTSIALVDRVKGTWDLMAARWESLPPVVHALLDEVGARVRRALALPSKEELATISARLDLLDARLRELSERKVEGLARAKATAALAVEVAAAAADLAPSTSVTRKVRAAVANKRT